MRIKALILIQYLGILCLLVIGSVLPDLIADPANLLIATPVIDIFPDYFILIVALAPLLLIWSGLISLYYKLKSAEVTLSALDRGLLKYLFFGYGLLILKALLTAWLLEYGIVIVEYARGILLLGASYQNFGLRFWVISQYGLYRAIVALIIGLFGLFALFALVMNRKIGLALLKILAYVYILFAILLIFFATQSISDLFTLEGMANIAISLTPGIAILALLKGTRRVFILETR